LPLRLTPPEHAVKVGATRCVGIWGVSDGDTGGNTAVAEGAEGADLIKGTSNSYGYYY